jgi:hypothetical protein
MRAGQLAKGEGDARNRKFIGVRFRSVGARGPREA